MSSNASIFSAECAALEDAVEFALANKDHSFIIFTDSHSVLYSLQYCQMNVQTNTSILKIKKTYNEHANIKFFWVPSHIGISGNDKADELAKMATRDNPNNKKLHFTDFHETLIKTLLHRQNII